MMRRKVRLVALSTLIGLGLWACGAGDDDGPMASDWYGDDGGDGDLGQAGDGDYFDGNFGDGDGAAGAGGVAGEDFLVEEIEDEDSFRAPVATGRYLWSANPESGRVALIDVVDLTVEVLTAGLYPTYLTAVPSSEDSPTALVLNVGSADATRFRVSNNTVLPDKVATHRGANRVSVSRSGTWAVAYSAKEHGQSLDPTEGLQEITVMKLGAQTMTSTRLVVGYRPGQVLVSEDETRLVVVCEEGISLIDLTSTPTQDTWIDLGAAAEAHDVSLSGDGNYALVRRARASTVDLIDLKDPDAVRTLQFSGRVTDVDLSPSGRAVAVIRLRSELATFRIEDVLEDVTAIDTLQIEGQYFGSATLTDDGSRVVLYMTAEPYDRINVVDLSQANFLKHRSISTQAAVYNVNLTPDGQHAVVLAADEVGHRAKQFSVVSLSTEGFPRIAGTSAPVEHVALANSFGIVTAVSLGISEAHLISLPWLSVREERLPTLPLSAGVMMDLDTAFVAQAHPEGRVTFFDFNANQARTLTGFELSAEVVDE